MTVVFGKSRDLSIDCYVKAAGCSSDDVSGPEYTD